MKRYKYLFMALMLIFALSITASQSLTQAVQAALQTGTVVKFNPSTVSLDAGQTATVDIVVENVTALTGFDVQIGFNPAVFQIQDSDTSKDGIQIKPGTFLSADFVVKNQVDNQQGALQIALTQLAPNEPVNGNGVIATFVIEAKANGSSELTISSAELANQDGQGITVTPQNGQVTVGEGSTPATTVAPTTAPATNTPVSVTNTPVSGPTATPLVPTATNTVPATNPTNTPIAMVTPTTVGSTATPLPVNETPANATIGFCYRVSAGDTLFSIAQTYGVDLYQVSRLNLLRSPDHIYANQALFIPTQIGTGGPKVYIVQAGDSLASIADACHLPVEYIAQVNGIAPSSTLSAGMAITVPLPPFPPASMMPPPSGPTYSAPMPVYPSYGCRAPVRCGRPHYGVPPYRYY